MRKLVDYIIKHKIIFLVIFAVLSIGSIFSTIFLTKINSDITSYLPAESDTSIGQKFLRENFNIKGDIEIAIAGKTEEELKVYLKQIENIEVVKGEKSITSVNWIGSPSFSMIKTIYPDKFKEIESIFVRTDKDGKKMYAVFITMNYIPSTDEANSVLNEVNGILKGTEYTISGSSNMTKSILEETIGEIWKYMLVAVSICLVILIVTSESFIDPLILILTLGISILINMGSNFIFKDVSIITYAASSILQLGLSMDYAIFMIHRYKSLREKGLEPKTAVAEAVPYTFATIASSALTTVGGFIALFFMRFTIGMDIGKVLVKGIILSLLTVIILEPCLILLFNKAAEKSKHKHLNLKFRKATGYVMRHKIFFVVVAFIFLIPSVLLQSQLKFNYLRFQSPPQNPSDTYVYAEKMANQIMLCVPVNGDEIDKQYELIKEIKSNGNVEFMLGLCSMIDDKNTAKTLISSNNDMVKQFVSNGYTMYTIGLNIPIESKEAIETIKFLHNTANKYFSKDYYMTGMAEAVSDFASITPRDFNIVNIISIAIILIILIFTLKSFKMSALLVLLIEFGIWINLGISYLFSGEINFMSYIIISSIQLGATVDYAILITTEYQKYRKKGMHPENAAFNAITNNSMAVITSVSILMGACLSVYFVTSNLIVGEITLLIARGSLISCILVLLVLPTILSVSSNISDRINAMRNSNKESDNGEETDNDDLIPISNADNNSSENNNNNSIENSSGGKENSNSDSNNSSQNANT